MKKVIFYIAVALLATGCRKYVEINQIGVRTLTYTSDYRALMDNSGEMESVFGLQIYSNDDTRILDANKQTQLTDIYNKAYQWQSQYYGDNQSDADWDRMFHTIYNCNLTLEGVLTSAKGSDADKKQIYAEAQVHRAFTYWSLVNIYAKQYDSATASTDLGVPMVVSSDLYANLKRGSVQAAYDMILNDLLSAVDALPDLPDYNTRPSKAGTYAVLARVYLSVRQFDKARSYAEKALALQSGLLDLRNFQTSTASFPQRLKDPEVIFSKVTNGTYQGIQLDTALLSLLGTSDLRYKLFVRPGSSFFPSFTGYGYWRYTYTREYSKMYLGPNVPEMMLIVAEVAARANDAGTAVTMINNIRQKRFATADYVPVNAATGTDAMQLVLVERRREFFGTGLRWFDQKRLNKDAAYAITETRDFKGVTTTLQPNSNRYVFPIANKYILLNPEIQQNPE